MVNPDWLRKRSREAEERLERQRKEEEAKRLKEEELRRLEEERLRRAQEERERIRKLVDTTIATFVRAAIKSALVGAKAADIEVDSAFITTEVESKLIERLQGMGYECYIRDSSKRWITTSRVVSKMLSRVASIPGTEHYRSQLGDALERQDEQRLLELTHDLRTDKSIALRPNDELFIRLHVIRHLESDQKDQIVCSLNGSWQPIDVVDARFTALHQAPSWMVSQGGAWLMERMGLCYQRDADRGLRETEFLLMSLPMKPERWGENEMTKFVSSGEPIGTSPFPDELMIQLLTVLGFKVRLEPTADARVMKVSW
ncbi:hypothetical protein GCM10025771_08160 [Niveibacterium umoris]|uniref:Uncharacterized protein n=1 Tax=Niveibacterium umoris TaxID=1193620 RepID=A0A840BTF5_9RHOO|nr:hypothetical protein [Niveibacterium umoris]MBB4013637.1 hypothetical protein [Niveibacterium umoris]